MFYFDLESSVYSPNFAQLLAELEKECDNQIDELDHKVGMFAIGHYVEDILDYAKEKGEDPFEAAKRELEEETGYKSDNWQSLGYINTTPGFCDEKLYLYLAKDLEFVGEHPDEGEIIQCFEYKIEEILDKIKLGEINDSKTICGLMRAFKL